VLPNALLGWWSSTSIVRYESAAATSCDEIIISGYDKQVAFQNYHTFAIDPSVHVPTASADGSISAAKLDAASATLVMAEVGASMTHMGYKHVDPHARPDLGIGEDQNAFQQHYRLWRHSEHLRQPHVGREVVGWHCDLLLIRQGIQVR